jgi:hypothetical protein
VVVEVLRNESNHADVSPATTHGEYSLELRSVPFPNTKKPQTLIYVVWSFNLSGVARITLFHT